MNRLGISTLLLMLTLAGCDGDTAATDAGSAIPDAGSSMASGEWAVLVRGPLAGEPAVMQEAHDAVAMGGEAEARMAGDFAHDVFLGTAMLGTTENQFLGVDRWSDLAGLQGFYANPDFQAGFSMLFASPPSVETFARADGWEQWGDLDAADGASERWWVVVRGRLADAPATIQPQHDMLAAGGRDMAMAAGDVAHVAYLGVEDEREIMLVDVWTVSDDIEAFYGNPDFQAGFGMLFEAPPTVGVYGSTDWHQW